MNYLARLRTAQQLLTRYASTWRRLAKRMAWGDFFSGLSSIATVAVAGLAFWAYFFTPLPEMLEKQLRTEVVAVQEELIEVRRNKARLEEEQNSLKLTNSALVTERDALEVRTEELAKANDNASQQAVELARTNEDLSRQQSSLAEQLKVLEAERAKLAADVNRLAAEREHYAKTTGRTVSAQLAVMVNYELDVIEHIASVCARYAEHRKWLARNRRFKEVEALWKVGSPGTELEFAL